MGGKYHLPYFKTWSTKWTVCINLCLPHKLVPGEQKWDFSLHPQFVYSKSSMKNKVKKSDSIEKF
jgi:hypothetical protein